MKTYATLFVLSCFWLANCSTKEKKSHSETITEVKEPFSKLEGSLVWKKGNQSIKLINGEESRTLFTGFKIGSLPRVVIRREGDTILCVGRIKNFGDLNQDGIPKFLLENIISTPS